MPLNIRAAMIGAALTLLAASRTDAQQSGSISVTIAGGPHAGKYELARGQCDPIGREIISLFTPGMAGVAEGPKMPERIGFYTEPGKKGTADGFSVNVDFRLPSRKRVVYEIYAIPPELQGPGLNKPPSGQGTVSIEQKAESTHASFRGQTKDGIRMEGSIHCGK